MGYGAILPRCIRVFRSLYPSIPVVMAAGGTKARQKVEPDCQENVDSLREVLRKDAKTGEQIKDVPDKALRRFLRAHLTVPEAHKVYVKCEKWRQKYGVENIKPEDPAIQSELATGKGIILEERDKMGRPIILVTVHLHDTKNRDMDVLTKFTVYMLETLSNMSDQGEIDNICVLFDMKDFSLRNMDYQFVKTLIMLLQRYFPERLGVCLIVNAPTLFSGCWLIIRPWLDERTRKKVAFVYSEEELSEYIGVDALPRTLF
ncbi:PREDICTED: CRAL-TRIO domain-containing protein C589.09, mitochondrial-like [Branchiostoma belcheri]|uniref:CRAL-TRIO domain-containing protein C589.09, mitochondrial-like n=1 Tax=Branchiostoma belcheri TaxID=7741 RepID=A0A6P4YB95_BRABE|nr:PREDICTED: CRAL-TRIO domain-containing protein C589.09, mitochondrial-like [Branchiostoma belcheri]